MTYAPSTQPAVDFDAYRRHIEAALEHAPGTHTLEDLRDGVRTGAFQLWVAPHSALLTQIQQYPQRKVLCLYLAGGLLNELLDLLPSVLDWARTQHGCQSAYIAGRGGWARVLRKHGWEETQVILERSL